MQNKLLNKHPKWKKLFKYYQSLDNSIDDSMVFEIFSVIQKYKKIFDNPIQKAYKLAELKDNRSLIERLNDYLFKTIHEHKKEQFINKLSTHKYKHLFSDDVKNIIHTLLDNNISTDLLNQEIFKKIARYDDQDDLYLSLLYFQEKNLSWSKEHILSNINNNNLNCNIIENKENSLLIKVNNYEACQQLGSQAWCIVQDEGYFSEYTDKHQQQYIFFDFSKKIDNLESMIGFTVNVKGTVSASYLRNDDETPKEIIDTFTFKPKTNKEINHILKTDFKTNKDRLVFIYENLLVDYFEDYLKNNRVNVTINVFPNLFFAVCIHLSNKKQSDDELRMIDLMLSDSRINTNDHSVFMLLNNMDVLNKLLKDTDLNPVEDTFLYLYTASQSDNLEIFKRYFEDERVINAIPEFKKDQYYRKLSSDARIFVNKKYLEHFKNKKNKHKFF